MTCEASLSAESTARQGEYHGLQVSGVAMKTASTFWSSKISRMSLTVFGACLVWEVVVTTGALDGRQRQFRIRQVDVPAAGWADDEGHGGLAEMREHNAPRRGGPMAKKQAQDVPQLEGKTLTEQLRNAIRASGQTLYRL